VLVSIGAGAALVGLISAVPQLIWLSEHKATVFTLAGLLLLGSGVLLWKARRLPCPLDPKVARSCQRLRKASHWLYGTAAIAYGFGAVFAFVLPMLR
jgi:LPXTG-motif cell wall-anchored protein